MYEVTQHVAQLSEVEEQLQQQSAAVEAAKVQLQQEKAAAAKSGAAVGSMKQLHAQQCQDLQAQIDIVSKTMHGLLQRATAVSEISVSVIFIINPIISEEKR